MFLKVAAFVILNVLIVPICGQCSWKKVEDGFLVNPIESVFYRTGCSTFKMGQQLDIVYVEREGSPPSDSLFPFVPATNVSTGEYGLQRELSWDYVRVFANIVGYCPKSSKILDSIQPKWKCFITGSGNVRWVGKGAFATSLILPPNKELEISLFAGMNDCKQPLETIGINDFLKCPNISESCRDYCAHVDMTLRPDSLANFTVSLPSPLPPTPTSADSCRMHSAVGFWNDAEWRSPVTCPPATPPKNSIKGVCVIGDSHMARSDKYLMHSARVAGIRLSMEMNFVQGPNLTVKLKGEAWHPKTASIIDSLSACAANVNRVKGGATVWWYGSHVFSLSPVEIGNTIRDAHAHMAQLDLNVCTIVVGSPVALYEDVPYRFGMIRKYYQNLWRLRAQNDKMREAVAKIPNFHYIDVYEESLALYYDGHFRGDPVHLSQKFYEYTSKVLFNAIFRYCG